MKQLIAGTRNNGTTYLHPNLSFDEHTAGYQRLYDFVFGTGVVAGQGQTKISNAAELGTYFNPKSNNAGADGLTKINKEIQNYVQDFNDTEVFNFTSNSLDLCAVLRSVIPSKLIQRNPSANVVNSDTIPLSDTSNLSVGQVVGFGARGEDNVRCTKVYAFSGTMQEGAEATIAISTRITEWSTSVTVKAGPTTTNANMAYMMVEALKNDPVFKARGGHAAVCPTSPQTFFVSFPRIPLTAPVDYGYGGKGSLDWVNYSSSYKLGASGWKLENKNNCQFTWITAINAGVSVTLNHSVNLLSTDTVTFNPCFAHVMDVDIFPSTTIPYTNTAALQVDQTVQLSYQDNNLRRIASINAGVSVTLEASVYLGIGQVIVFLPVHRKTTSQATTNGNTLTFAATPPGVEIGHQIMDYFSSNWKCLPLKVTGVTGTTVTLDTNVTIGNGGTVMFYPQIDSGQIWSKFLTAPSLDGAEAYAYEIDAQANGASAIGHWPAFWMFNDPTDPNAVLTNQSGVSEIDWIDPFTYFNNLTSNTIRFGGGGSVIYNRSPIAASDGNLLANNLGPRRRKYQGIWTKNAIYFFVDGVMMYSKTNTLEARYRKQLAANLAIGSINTSFNSNGFFPIDFSQFTHKFRIFGMKVLKLLSV